jgi:hypothetical protein
MNCIVLHASFRKKSEFKCQRYVDCLGGWNDEHGSNILNFNSAEKLTLVTSKLDAKFCKHWVLF